MKIYTYRNMMNDHKYIEVHSYGEGHYSWKQFMRTPIITTRIDMPEYFISIIGGSCKRPIGYFHRVSKRTMDEVLQDYIFVQDGSLIR